MTIDDERAAFMRDLLRVLTSLYSWAGAVVHGTTEDGHDVIELCDGTRVWTETARAKPYWTILISRNRQTEGIQERKPTKRILTSIALTAMTAAHDMVHRRVEDLLSGPPEDK